MAGRDFSYDDGKIGDVKLGQIFQLQGHPNDALLVKHNLVSLLEPQPKKAALEALPVCGTCGRCFLEEWQRDKCGESHEMTAEEAIAQRRVTARQRVQDALGPRVIQVGA
jgi:hypothetical protein